MVTKFQKYGFLAGPLLVKKHSSGGIRLPGSDQVNPACTKLFGTHAFYEWGGGLSQPSPPPPYDLENGRLYKL